MLVDFFLALRNYQVPVTLREFMHLIVALEQRIVFSSLDDFYVLSRTCMVKDEKNYDKFDRAFGAYFDGLDSLHGMLESLIPDEWLRREFERSLTPEDLDAIESLGGLDRLIEQFRGQREAAKQEAHSDQVESTGSSGDEERHGEERQEHSGRGRNQRGRRNWDHRKYENLDDSIELGTRNIKIALRRLREFARTGKEDELDIDGTIHATASNGGLLDIRKRPERRNQVKVLAFFDVGGSMDPHIRICEELFSATRSEFKHLESFYFHNFRLNYIFMLK